MTNLQGLMMTMLDCGVADLCILDNVNYEWSNILTDKSLISDIIEASEKCQAINRITMLVVDYGKSKIKERISSRINELLNCAQDSRMTDFEHDELEALRTLDPDDDIRSLHNSVDSHVYFKKNGAAYHKYLSKALEDFRYGTGFEIEDDWE